MERTVFLFRGTKKPSLAVPTRLAESLGVTVNQLLTGNQVTDKTAYYSKVQELLEDCTTCERAVLTDIISTVKRSIREHRLSCPP